MNKPRRATDLLNVELARISAAISVMGTVLGEQPPDTPYRAEFLRLLEEAEKGHKAAVDLMRAIAKAAATI